MAPAFVRYLTDAGRVDDWFTIVKDTPPAKTKSATRAEAGGAL